MTRTNWSIELENKTGRLAVDSYGGERDTIYIEVAAYASGGKPSGYANYELSVNDVSELAALLTDWLERRPREK